MIGTNAQLSAILHHLGAPREVDRLEIDIGCVDALPQNDVAFVAMSNLRSLTLRLGWEKQYGHLPTRLVEVHRDTLESLELTVLGKRSPSGPNERLPPFSQPFPRLRKLDLAFDNKTSAMALSPLLDSITLARFPALKSIRLRAVELGNLGGVAPSFVRMIAQPDVVFTHKRPIRT